MKVEFISGVQHSFPIKLNNVFLLVLATITSFLTFPMDSSSMISHLLYAWSTIFTIGFATDTQITPFHPIAFFVFLFLLAIWLYGIVSTLLTYGLAGLLLSKSLKIVLLEKEIYPGTNQDTLHVEVSFGRWWYLPGIRVSGCLVFQTSARQNQPEGTTYYYSKPKPLPFAWSYRSIWTLPHIPRGNHRLHHISIEVMDVLGLFCYRMKKSLRESCTVFVAPQDLLPLQIPLSISDDLTSDIPAEQIESEPYDMRKYVPGDELRRIHWKMFAKKQDLIIRKPEKDTPHLSDIFVFACFYLPNMDLFSPSVLREAEDTYLSYLVGFLNQAQSAPYTIHFVHETLQEPIIFRRPGEIQSVCYNLGWQEQRNSTDALTSWISNPYHPSETIKNVFIITHGLMIEAIPSLSSQIQSRSISYGMFHVSLPHLLPQYWAKKPADPFSWKSFGNRLLFRSADQPTVPMVSFQEWLAQRVQHLRPMDQKRYRTLEEEWLSMVQLQSLPFYRLEKL